MPKTRLQRQRTRELCEACSLSGCKPCLGNGAGRLLRGEGGSRPWRVLSGWSRDRERLPGLAANLVSEMFELVFRQDGIDEPQDRFLFFLWKLVQLSKSFIEANVFKL